MKIKSIRISGFQPIPFCAQIRTESDEELHLNNNEVEIKWEECAFEILLSENEPYLNALIGPNSSGKSSIFHSMSLFFSNRVKLEPSFFNEKKVENEIIVEMTFYGVIDTSNNWYIENLSLDNKGRQEITIANVWNSENRITYIKVDRDLYKKVMPKERPLIQKLLPEFRMIAADSKLSDEASPEKKSLITDLIVDVLENRNNLNGNSAINRIRENIEQLAELVKRNSSASENGWKEFEELERKLSEDIVAMTPGKPTVRFRMENNLPTIEDIFLKGQVSIEDGVELEFEKHGLGLQRSFIVSALRVWTNYIGHKTTEKDYIFVIEEPELYLHPHAIRVFLSTLLQISESDQVLFSTHSREFINSIPYDNVVRIIRNGNHRSVIQPDLSELTPDEKMKVQRYLREDSSDMLFANSVLLVEGQSELFAFPLFAKVLNKELDQRGVSIVYVNGKGNFKTYHNILSTFSIPHVIFADGDGEKGKHETKYKAMTSHCYVLDYDFEYLIASIIDDKLYLEIINQSRKARGLLPLEMNQVSEKYSSESLRKYWWEKLKDEINSVILSENRTYYDSEKQQLYAILEKMAESVIVNRHFSPDLICMRRAATLKNLGKPLLGRVVGEILPKVTIKKMETVVNSIECVISLSERDL